MYDIIFFHVRDAESFTDIDFGILLYLSNDKSFITYLYGTRVFCNDANFDLMFIYVWVKRIYQY